MSPPAANSAAFASSASLCFHAKLPANLAFLPYPWAANSIFIFYSCVGSSWKSDYFHRLALENKRDSHWILLACLSLLRCSCHPEELNSRCMLPCGCRSSRKLLAKTSPIAVKRRSNTRPGETTVYLQLWRNDDAGLARKVGCLEVVVQMASNWLSELRRLGIPSQGPHAGSQVEPLRA